MTPEAPFVVLGWGGPRKLEHPPRSISSSQLPGALFYPKTRDGDFPRVHAGPAGLPSRAQPVDKPPGARDRQLHESTPVHGLHAEGTVLLLVSSLPIPTAGSGTRQPEKRCEPIPDDTHGRVHARTRTHVCTHTRTPYWSVSWALKRFCFVLSLFSKANQSFLLAKLVDSFFCRLFCGLCFVFVLKPCPSQHREGSRAGTGPWQERAEKSVPSSRSCTGHIKTTLRRAV